MTTTFERERDRHLFDPGPKRLLALDGGGVRGAITVAFLEQIERRAAQAPRQGRGRSRRLVRSHRRHLDRLDHRGRAGARLHIQDIKRFYLELARKVFSGRSGASWGCSRSSTRRAAQGDRRHRRRLTLDSERADHRALRRHQAHGHRQPLDPLQQSPRALLGVPGIKKAATGSVATWCAPARRRRSTSIPNDHNRRADEQPGLFVDGGVTPHNNPSLAILLHDDLLKPFDICWELGPDKLTVVSIGTGSHRDRRRAGRARHGPHHQARDPRADLADERRADLRAAADAVSRANARRRGRSTPRSARWPATRRRTASCSASCATTCGWSCHGSRRSLGVGRRAGIRPQAHATTTSSACAAWTIRSIIPDIYELAQHRRQEPGEAGALDRRAADAGATARILRPRRGRGCRRQHRPRRRAALDMALSRLRAQLARDSRSPRALNVA